MPITGLILAPLTAILFFGPWRRFLVFVFIVGGVFADAAIVNFSSFGIQPGYCSLLLVVARTLAELFLSGKGIRGDQLRLFLPLLLFVALSIVILFGASALYDGLIKVQASRDGLASTGTPFHFRFENYAQQIYLMSNSLGTICIAHQVRRMGAGEVSHLIRQSVLGFIFIASGVALWELLHFSSGVYFPATELFHNNVGYSVSAGQTFTYGYRISGPFAEPSALGYYFAGCLLFSYRYRELEKSAVSLLALVASMALMMISTSTAAYSFVAIFLVVLALLKGRRMLAMMASWITRGAPDLRFDPMQLAVFLLVGSVAALVLIFRSDLVSGVIKEFILEKHRGESFAQRSAADAMALDVLRDSFGMGVGLGSHKANTLPMTILSNTGIVGLIIFIWFLAGCFYYCRERLMHVPQLSAVILPMLWFVSGLIVQHCLMNPNLNTLILWVAIGFLIGGAGIDQTVTERPRDSNEDNFATGSTRLVRPDP